MNQIKHAALPALRMFLFLAALTGVIYICVIAGGSRLLFPGQSQGSLQDTSCGKMSLLAGQSFQEPEHLQGRPQNFTAVLKNGKYYLQAAPAETAYGDSETLFNQEKLKEEIRRENPEADGEVPAELYTPCASGMDPDISMQAAFYQIPRIAAASGLSRDTVKDIILKNASSTLQNGPQEQTVRVSAVNLQIDQQMTGE